VQTCFDADRLDLERVGNPPEPELLCTTAARDQEMIAWALQNSRTDHISTNIMENQLLG